MVAILTKYLGPTNTRGGRIKAYRGDDPKTCATIDYPHDAPNTETAHAWAARQLLAKAFHASLHDARLVGGGIPGGYAFVFDMTTPGRDTQLLDRIQDIFYDASQDEWRELDSCADAVQDVCTALSLRGVNHAR